MSASKILVGLNDRLKDNSTNEKVIVESIEKLNEKISLGWKAAANPDRDPKKLPEVTVDAETVRSLEELAQFLSSNAQASVSIGQ